MGAGGMSLKRHGGREVAIECVQLQCYHQRLRRRWPVEAGLQSVQEG